MSCICEKHKGELKSLSLQELKLKFADELLKMKEINNRFENQYKIVNILFDELESRK